MAATSEGIFSKQKINFSPPDNITHLLSSNNVLVLALANKTLLRISLQNSEDQSKVDIPLASGDEIGSVFLDPTGYHLILSTKNGEVFYLHKNMPKLKPLTKMKGNVITAVGWNGPMSKDATTNFIVLGTSRGLLFETEILQNGTTQYFKQLFCVSDDPNSPKAVTGVKLHRCLNPASRWFVFVVTPGQLYPFAGNVSLSSGNWTDSSAVLHTLFLAYQNNPGRIHTLDPMPLANSPSQLETYPVVGMEPPEAFAWLAGPGIEYGTVDSEATDPFKIIVGEKLVPHPEVNGRAEWPLGMVLTEYHMLVLYRDRLTAISLLNEQITYEDILGQKFGKMVGISRDHISGLIWVYTERNVLKYRSIDETRFLWKVYLDREDYMMARRFASQNEENLDVVLREEALKLMADKKFVAAAEVYAMTRAPFEDTSLRFIEGGDREGLRTYLMKKLDKLDSMDKTQMTMLVFWLLEIHLTELGEAKAGKPPKSSFPAPNPFAGPQPPIQPTGHDFQRFKTLRNQFKIFLRGPKVMECMKGNPEAVYQMMTSHGDVDSLLYFAELMRDWEQMIALSVQQERYDEALKVIQNQSEAVMKYVEFTIQSLEDRDSSIHNFFISLCAKKATEKLLPYLRSQGTDSQLVPYDIKYALRLCTECHLDEACVHLYRTLGLHEDAVTLALKFDVELAKESARLADAEEEDDRTQSLRKKLWLLVARHVVEKEQDIEKCMELLQESDNLVKIQDLLPFFPDFATIDHFKDSLCECLKEHSGRIQELQKEMKEATEVAQDIRKDMHRLRQRSHVIRVQDICAKCSEPLISREFYAFPCWHHFHAECVETEMKEHFSPENEGRLLSLRRQLASLRQSTKTASGGYDTDSLQSYHVKPLEDEEAKILTEIDEIVAGECPFCGDLMVESLDKPFYTPAEYSKELRSWDIR